MHGEKNFPFRKQRSSLDVGLEDGLEDAGYLALLDRYLAEVFDVSKADVCFYQAGVDALAEDSLGRLALTHEGLAARDAYVMETARAKGLPLVLTMGGGYAKPIERSVEAHARTYVEARRIFGS